MYFYFLDKEKNIVDEIFFKDLFYQKENILIELLNKEIIVNLNEEKIQLIKDSTHKLKLSSKNLFPYQKKEKSLLEALIDISCLVEISTQHGNQTGDSIINNSLIAIHETYADLLFLLNTLCSGKTFYLSNKEYSHIFSFFVNKFEEHLKEHSLLLENKKSIQQLKKYFDKNLDVFIFFEPNKYTKETIRSTDVLKIDPDLVFLKTIFENKDFDLETISDIYEEHFEDECEKIKLEREIEEHSCNMNQKPDDFYFDNNYNILTIFIDNKNIINV